MTYEEFMNTIPEDTKKYVNRLFQYLDVYIKREDRIYHKDHCKYFDSEYNYSSSGENIYNLKIILSCLIGLALDEKNSSVVGRYGFDYTKISIDKSPQQLTKEKEKQLYDLCNKLFYIYNDTTGYSSLLPIDIVINALSLSQASSKSNLFRYLDINSKIESDLKQISTDEHAKIDLEKEKTVYANLPFETIKYIETAAKIRSVLIEKISSNNLTENDYIKKEDTYLVPLSLLLAVYEYNGEEKNAIENYFASKGMDLGNIYQTIGINLTYDLKNAKRNMNSIQLLYRRYWELIKNDGTKEESIKIVDIVDKILDRNFTHSIVIEKILNNFHIDVTDLSNIKEEVEALDIQNKTSLFDEKTKKFYTTIGKDTRDFINFSCKAYQVLIKKMKEGNQNKDILAKEDDADTLAIYIASYFYNTGIADFYNEHGVTFEKIMKLLNIELTKEEIEKEKLDKQILYEKFRRFVISGVNSNKSSESITIEDVSYNLCNRDFNKSMIMENIFEEIRRDINLPNDFFSMLKKFLVKRENELKRQEKEEYFKNLPIEDLDFLTNVCQKYYWFKNNKNYCDDLIVVLSLLTVITQIKNNRIKEYFKMLGITFETLNNEFDIPNHTSGELNIDLLKTKFHKYIYEGRNKGNNSPSIEDIAFNIFNEELYKSTELVSYLASLNLSYETFKDTKKLKETLEQKIVQAIKNDVANKKLNRYDNLVMRYFHNATVDYNKITNLYRKNKEAYPNITSEEDIEILSLLLSAIYTEGGVRTYYSKYHVTKEDILKYLNIPLDYQQWEVIEDSDNTLANVFIKYLDYDRLLNVFPDITNNKFYQDLMNRFADNPIALEKELQTGCSYEETLTLSERIELIRDTKIQALDMTSISNVLNFGSDLELHTIYIQNEYPKLMSSDEISKSTEEIKRLIGSVYVETEITEEPKSLFQRLFGSTPTTRKEVKLNPKVINSLKPNIDTQIEKLHSETRKLVELKEYMEEYRKKNMEYIAVIVNSLEQAKKSLSELNADDYLKINDYKSYISVLENKLQMLQTTDLLMKQEYIKINQTIVNHCITINSLFMSRNTLLPLIASSMLIGNGINTEKEGIDITRQLLNLLNDVISQDSIKTEEILEGLKRTNISEEQLSLLTTTINRQLEENSVLKNQAESTELILEMPSSKEITPVIPNMSNNDIKQRKKTINEKNDFTSYTKDKDE